MRNSEFGMRNRRSWGSTRGTEVAFDLVMKSDENEGDDLIAFSPDDADGLAHASFKDLLRTPCIQQLDTKSERGLARGVVGADLAVGFHDERLFMAGEAIEALEVALLVEELHLTLLGPLSQHRTPPSLLLPHFSPLYP